MFLPPEAALQSGAFTRRQARTAGIARDTIRNRLRDGRWQKLSSDVFAAGTQPRDPLTLGWAAHLATGGIAAISTAAAIHQVAEPTGEMHVISRTRVHVRAPGVHEHRVRLAPTDVAWHGRLPLTTRLRTVVDLLAAQQKSAARTLLFRAVQQEWIDGPLLAQQIRQRSGMNGNNQLRELLELLGTGAHSVAELALHRVLDDFDGLRYRANAPVVVNGNRYVVDVLLPDHGIVIEVDGRRFHSGSEQFAHDRRRQNHLVGAGHIVLRFTWLDVTERPATIHRTIADAIAVSSGELTRRTGP